MRRTHVSSRLFILVGVFFALLPPTLAYGFTRYRYASGTISGDVEWTLAGSTSGLLNREYNNVYRAEGCNSGWWRSEYRKSPGNFSDITSANETNCSPTSIGATVGPRQALCYKTSISIANTVTYNCDTTIP